MSSEETIVHVEPWVFHSPDQALEGRKVDVGLVAEALIFYERVYFAFTTDEQFVRLAEWFQSQGGTNELINLLSDGTLVPYYYAFSTLPGQKNNIWGVLNLQDEEAGKEPVFERRVLQSGRLAALIRKASRFEALTKAALSHHVEVKALEFGGALTNAEADYSNPDRAALLMQTIYDELYTKSTS